MTVREVVSANVGRQIKLGFGSSFVYCNLIDESSEKEIAIISGMYLENFKSNLTVYSGRLEQLKQKGEEKYVAEQLEKKIREYPRCNIEHFRKVFTEQYYESIDRNEALVVSIKWSIKNFVPFLDANVEETYESEDEDALIAISSDNKKVVGSFWSCGEYRECRAKGRYW